MSYTYAIAKRPRSHGFINDSDRVVCAHSQHQQTKIRDLQFHGTSSWAFFF